MSTEDSGNEATAYTEMAPADRALTWAEEIRSRPLNDEQATELAKVYAALAAVEAQNRTAAALEALREPLEWFRHYVMLTVGESAPEGVSADEDPQTEGVPE